MSLTKAWATWPLVQNHPWDVYITLTFPTPTNEERALRLWKQFTDKTAKEVLPCRKARKEGLPWLATVERHRSGNCHIHALMSGVTDFDLIANQWLNVTGSKIIDIQKYDPNGSTLAYVTKAANTCDVTLARYFNYV